MLNLHTKSFVLSALMAAASVSTLTAAPVINGFGLFDPAVTITFDEIVLPEGTIVTNQYASLGVTFSPSLVYDSFPGEFPPNVTGRDLENFVNADGNQEPSINPFVISFATSQTGAAFAMVTNTGTSNFAALLDGELVESFSTATNQTSTENYYGFSGITFDAIQVTVFGDNQHAAIDNLQMGTAAVAIPEPSHLAFVAIGSLGITFFARRRRRHRRCRVGERVVDQFLQLGRVVNNRRHRIARVVFQLLHERTGPFVCTKGVGHFFPARGNRPSATLFHEEPLLVGARFSATAFLTLHHFLHSLHLLFAHRTHSVGLIVRHLFGPHHHDVHHRHGFVR